jgi:Lrp/AsnC family leucine-responsive transcriptional regulator
METAFELDQVDRRLLQALQADGRATYDQLAQAVGLSASAT